MLHRTKPDLMEFLAEESPHPALLPRALELLADAESFREPEHRLETFILPWHPL